MTNTKDAPIQHSPEPWTMHEKSCQIVSKDGNYVVDRFTSFLGNFRNHDLDEANAKRIVRCVNACADWSNDALESLNFYEYIKAVEFARDLLTRENTQLHASLSYLTKALPVFLSMHPEITTNADKEAIKNAEYLLKKYGGNHE